MPDTIISGSPQLRKRMALVAIPTLLACLALLYAFEAYMHHIIPVAPDRAEQLLITAFRSLAVFTGLVTMGLVGGVGAILVNVIKAGQYPPPGGHVVPWNTKLRTGRAATRPASIGLVVLGGLFLLGIGASVVIWQLGCPLPPPTPSSILIASSIPPLPIV